MQAEKNTDMKVGLTVLIGTVLLFLGIGWAKGWTFGAQEQIVKARFSTVGGLEVGDPVTINGVKKGSVGTIESDSTGVLIEMHFPQKVDLRKDATASIMMLELMGGKKVEMQRGVDPALLPKDAVLHGNYSGDIGTLVEIVNGVSTNLKSLVMHGDTLFASLNDMLAGGEMKENVRNTLLDAQRSLANLDKLTQKVNFALDENTEPLKNTLTQAERAAKDVSDVLEDNRVGFRSFLDSTRLAVTDARTTLGKINTLMTGLDTTIAKSKRNRTVLYRLVEDGRFALQLDSLLNSASKFLDQIRLQGLDANIRFFQSAKPMP